MNREDWRGFATFGYGGLLGSIASHFSTWTFIPFVVIIYFSLYQIYRIEKKEFSKEQSRLGQESACGDNPIQENETCNEV